MVSFLERNFWLTILLLAGLLMLVTAVVAGLGGRLPSLKPLPRPGMAPGVLLPREQMERLFGAVRWPSPEGPTNAINPFYTLHFQPPAPPPTKKIELLYQGCTVSWRGEKRAYVQLGNALLVLTNGARVAADHGILDITPQALTLTNAAGQTNVLRFNAKGSLVVPAS